MFVVVRNLCSEAARVGHETRRKHHLFETIVNRNVFLAALVLMAFPGFASAFEKPIILDEPPSSNTKTFRAGACAFDAAPAAFPVFVNGGFLPNRASKLVDPIYARSLVLDDGSTRLAIVVVDSCMMPRDLLDRAKELAHAKTGIPTDRILIAATHTHSAPAAMGALGCPADTNYVAALPEKIARSIERANQALEPARVGWTAVDDDEHTFCRRWIRRPDKMLDDPFGQRIGPGQYAPRLRKPRGPGTGRPGRPGSDCSFSAIEARAARSPLLANYSMHYYGADPVSADYFGRFAAALAKRIGAQDIDRPFVGVMSQGTSGDQMWMDYGRPRRDPGLAAYAEAVAQVVQRAYQSIAYRESVSLAMAEARIVLDRRVPDAARLAWAREIVGRMAGRDIPNSLPEVYAKEAIMLHENPRRELKLQAIRIGELGIAAIPNEVFAITGLKIKARSPLATTMNIELANGSEGYIPPPEQHAFGGYTTWPARTAALEVQAEPRIVAAVLGLLEQVAARPARNLTLVHGRYAESVLASKPLAYWRLDDIEGPRAFDSAGKAHGATYEGRVAYYLPAFSGLNPTAAQVIDRAVYFAGGHLRPDLDRVPATFGVEFWFWNALPTDARAITGTLIAFDGKTAGKTNEITLSIGGTRNAAGHLVLTTRTPRSDHAAGKSVIVPRTWHHLFFERDGRRVRVYLDGQLEIETTLEGGAVDLSEIRSHSPTIGGLRGGDSNFEGKIDEVALYDRTLEAHEIAKHLRAAGQPLVPVR